jgi:hypothetical protein
VTVPIHEPGGNFACGHPRTPENSTRGYLNRNGIRYPQCALCHRVRAIVAVVDRQLARWKAGELTPHEKILRSVA